MKTKVLKYEDAFARLTEITHNMEAGKYEIDEIVSKLKEAKQLIALCRSRLADAEKEIQNIQFT